MLHEVIQVMHEVYSFISKLYVKNLILLETAYNANILLLR